MVAVKMSSFFLFLCLSSASLHPIDLTSSLTKVENKGDNFSYSIHESRGLHIPAPLSPDHVGIFSPKTVPSGTINQVNFMNPAIAAAEAATGFAEPLPYSQGAHPVIHAQQVAPKIPIHDGFVVPYIGHTYPVIEMPKELKA